MRKRYWVYAFLICLTTINFIDRVALSLALPQISKEFVLSPVEMGYLLSSFTWLYVVALIPMGMIVDKVGARVVSAWGIAIWSAATAVTALTGGFFSLIATRLVMGLGESTSYPAGGSVLRQWSPRKERGTATAVMNAGSVIGPAIGALALGWLVGQYGWRTTFVIAAAIGFVWLFAWLVWYREPEKATWLSAEERAYILASRTASQDTNLTSEDTARLGLRGVMRSPALWAIAVAHGCAVYAIYLFLTWLPAYLQAEKGLSVVRSGVFMAIPYLGAGILAILLGRLGDAYAAGGGVARRRTVAALSILLAAVVLLIPVVKELWFVTLLFTLSLAGGTAAIAANLSLVNDLLPTKHDSGTAYGFVSVGGNGIGLLAPIITGYAIRSTGHFEVGFVIAGIMLLVGALIMVTLTRAPIRMPAANTVESDGIRPPVVDGA